MAQLWFPKGQCRTRQGVLSTFSPQNCPTRLALLLFPFYRGGKGGIEWSSHSSKVTQPVGGRPGIPANGAGSQFLYYSLLGESMKEMIDSVEDVVKSTKLAVTLP